MEVAEGDVGVYYQKMTEVSGRDGEWWWRLKVILCGKKFFKIDFE